MRVLRVKLPAGARTPPYRRALKSVTVLLTAAHLREVRTKDSSEETVRQAHDVVWDESAAVTQLQNLGTAPFEAVLVEVKSR